MAAAHAPARRGDIAWPNEPDTCAHDTTSGSLVAATYPGGGHHVIECAGCGSWLCAQAQVVDCAVCGRSPAEHEELARAAADPGNQQMPLDDPRYNDCTKHVPHKACKCGLPPAPEVQ